MKSSKTQCPICKAVYTENQQICPSCQKDGAWIEPIIDKVHGRGVRLGLRVSPKEYGFHFDDWFNKVKEKLNTSIFLVELLWILEDSGVRPFDYYDSGYSPDEIVFDIRHMDVKIPAN